MRHINSEDKRQRTDRNGMQAYWQYATERTLVCLLEHYCAKPRALRYKASALTKGTIPNSWGPQ